MLYKVWLHLYGNLEKINYREGQHIKMVTRVRQQDEGLGSEGEIQGDFGGW